MKTIEVPPLSALLALKTSEISEMLKKVCTKSGEEYWFLKSDVPKAVTLVCHIDTVHSDTDTRWDYELKKQVTYKVKRRIFFDRAKQVFIGPDGLGGDDRAGVFGVLRVYNALPDELKPNLLFCDKEERGGAGSRSAAKELPELGESLFMVELDRKGSKDCVFYNDEPEDFVKYIEGFGFKKATGTFSDVSHLGRAFDLCTTNLSIGYYDEHTRYETLYCAIVEKTIQKTIEIVSSGIIAGKTWEIPKAVPVSRGKYIDNYYDGYGYGVGSYRQGGLYGADWGYNKTPEYTEDELSRYPYLRDLTEMVRNNRRLNGFQ